MQIFDPDRPRAARALLTLRYAKQLNTREANTVTQPVLDAATTHLCRQGFPASAVQRTMLAGGFTQAEVDAQIDSCY